MCRLLSTQDTLECPLSSSPVENIACERIGIDNSFKCYDRSNPSKALFIKKTTERSTTAVTGLSLFSRYVPNMTPSFYHLDQKENYMLTEFLEGYEMLRDGIIRGCIDADTVRQIGTVMGRNHARSHSSLNNATLTKQYMHLFNKQEVYEEYNEKWLGVEIGHAIQRELLLEIVEEEEDVGMIKEAIEALRSMMLEKKESLVHANLNCGNIMVSTGEIDASSGRDSILKVVDFEKFSYGPTGIDLGVYLCNHYWYYAAHTSGSSRRNLKSATKSVLDAYKSAFYVQANNALRQKDLKDVSVDQVFNVILRDAIGFAGLFTFMHGCAIHDSEMLPLRGFREFNFGDREGWKRAVRKRQLRMSIQMLLKYNEAVKEDSTLTFDHFNHILESDDRHLTTEHFTEFWN